jgi:hypothetical protein
MQASVTQTELLEYIVKKKDRPRDGLGLLGGADGAAGNSALAAAARAKAARAALREKLSSEEGAIELWENMEQRLAAQLGSQHLKRGEADPESRRSWLERKSRFSPRWENQIVSAHLAAGIHGALVAGKVEEARARSILMVAVLEQHSLMDGKWWAAEELMLEDPVDLSCHSNGRDKAVDYHEAPQSALIDPTWMTIVCAYAKSVTEDHKALKDLSAMGPPGKKGPGAPVITPEPKAKWKGAGKGDPAADPKAKAKSRPQKHEREAAKLAKAGAVPPAAATN